METTASASTLVVGGVSLGYAVHGDAGPWITVLHGGMVDSRTWDDHVPGLAAMARVLTLDFRGYGRSGRPSGGYSTGQLADDVVGLWDALGIQHSIVVGFSMGGFIALEAVARAADRISALMLLGTAAGLPDAAKESFAERAQQLENHGIQALGDPSERVFSAAFAQDNPELMASYRRSVAENDAGAVAAAFRAIARYDRSDTVHHISCPVVIVCGEQDAAIPIEGSLQLHEAISNSRLVLIPDAGHSVHIEQPEQVAALLRELITGRGGTPAQWK